MKQDARLSGERANRTTVTRALSKSFEQKILHFTRRRVQSQGRIKGGLVEGICDSKDSFVLLNLEGIFLSMEGVRRNKKKRSV